VHYQLLGKRKVEQVNFLPLKNHIKMERKVNILLTATLMVVLFFWVKSCERNENLKYNMGVAIDNVRTYTDKNGELIIYNDVMDIKNRDLELYNKELADELKNMKMKKPEVVIKSTTKIRLDTVYVKFTDTLPCDDFIRDIHIDSTHYDIDIRLTKDSLSINRIEIPNEQIIVVGEKKNGLFKRNEYVVSVKNSNPNITTDTLETYTFKSDVGFFKRPIVNAVIGVAVGATIMKLIGK